MGSRFVSTMSRSRVSISTLSKSESRQRKKCLDSWEISVEIETSQFLPDISLNQDREIHRDLKILAFLDSLFWSQSRSAWILVFSCLDFSIRRDFSSFTDSKGLENVKISRQISTAYRQISTISTRLNNLDKNLDVSKSWLKSLDFKNLDQEK